MRRGVVSLLNIFLDDGGVITDKQQRAAEFGRLVGDCFVPLLGGTEGAWTRAHRAVVDWLADAQSASALAAADFAGFYRAQSKPSVSCIARGTRCTLSPGRARWNWLALWKGWVCGTALAVSMGPT